MDVALNVREEELLSAYAAIFKHADNKVPSWAYPVAPPIPVVGNDYPKDGGGTLVYASAENLGYTWDPANPTIAGWKSHVSKRAEEWPWFASYDSEMVRGRMMQGELKGTNVHIQPINDGSLLKVARYILQVARPDMSYANDPVAFLDQIAVANPGKFSIRPKDGEKAVNYDYAANWKMFEEQIDYIASDLVDLRPSILIVPTTILRSLTRSGLWPSLEAHKPELIIGIRQIQPRAIRRKHGSRVPRDGGRTLPDGYGGWEVPDVADTYIRWMIENDDRFIAKQGRIEL